MKNFSRVWSDPLQVKADTIESAALIVRSGSRCGGVDEIYILNDTVLWREVRMALQWLKVVYRQFTVKCDRQLLMYWRKPSRYEGSNNLYSGDRWNSPGHLTHQEFLKTLPIVSASARLVEYFVENLTKPENWTEMSAINQSLHQT